MATWDIYDGNTNKLLRARVHTDVLAPTLLELQGYFPIPFVLRPGGSPHVHRALSAEDTFTCPVCTHAVLVGDVYAREGDGRACSVFCLRRLTTR